MSNTALDREELRAFFAEELELPSEEITDEAEFAADLGVDSLASMEIMVLLEKRYNVRLSEDELAKLASLNQVYDVLSAKLQAA